jgi:hypothetical protein
MDGYQVQTAALLRYANSFGSVQSRLRQITTRMADLDAGVTGHAGLAEALRHFADEWEYSIGKIGEHAGANEEKLRMAAGTYDASDKAAAATIQHTIAGAADA